METGMEPRRRLVTLAPSYHRPEQPRTRQKGMHPTRRGPFHPLRKSIRRSQEAHRMQARGNESYGMESPTTTPTAGGLVRRYGSQVLELVYTTTKTMATSTKTITRKIAVELVAPPYRMVHIIRPSSDHLLPMHDHTGRQRRRTRHRNSQTGTSPRNNGRAHRRLFLRVGPDTRKKCTRIRHPQVGLLTPVHSRRSSLWMK
jgi:hypothetical protein